MGLVLVAIFELELLLSIICAYKIERRGVQNLLIPSPNYKLITRKKRNLKNEPFQLQAFSFCDDSCFLYHSRSCPFLKSGNKRPFT